MADTTLNINLKPDEWLDFYTEAGLAVGTVVAIQNIGERDVFGSSKATMPSEKYPERYRIISADYRIEHINEPDDSGLWLMSPNVAGKVNYRIVT